MAQAQKAAPQSEALAIMKRDVVDVTAGRVRQLQEQGELEIPENYSVNNALQAAWLKIQAATDRNSKPVLEVCTKNSIANAILDMVVQGLDPSRSQCYFVAYGSQLICQRSYFGTLALLKRIYGQDTEIFTQPVYEGDELEYEIVRGRKMITRHTQAIANVHPDKVVAAYAIIDLPGRETICEIMTKEQIVRAWKQGAAGGNSPAHQKFGDEMARKTVANRASKIAINSADDSHLVSAARRQDMLVAQAELEAELETEANSGPALELSDGGEGEVIEVPVAEVAPAVEVPSRETTGNQGRLGPEF